MFGNDALVDELRNQLTLAEARYDALLEKYHALRTAGANAAPTGLPLQSRSMKPADEAIELVCARFPQWPQLRRQLQRHVMKERMLPGYDDEAELKIAESVKNWRDPDSDEEGVA